MERTATPPETPSDTQLEPTPEAASPYRDPEPFEAIAQGQKLCFFPSGSERLERLLSLIDAAKESLKLAFYIYADDGCGGRVREALVAAARRGVAVSLIVDGFGAAVDEAYFAELETAGGKFCIFGPKWSGNPFIRNHQKIVIVDERIAMLGGFNIEEDYFAPPEENGWRDLAFTVEGSLVGLVAEWFCQLEQWTADPHAPLRNIRRRVRHWNAGRPPVQLLIGGPTGRLSSWAWTVTRDMIHGERLDMIVAYFSPAMLLLRRIRSIARKGHTHLVFAGKSDNPATIGASRSLYKGLLRSGAKIYEFQPCKLHTKLIVLDDAVYLGSANFDMRSLYINLEIVVRIEDRPLAQRMREFVADHEPASLQVTPAVYRKWATPWNRLRWWLSWFLVTVVDYTVSRKLNLGL
jgi:cardiolipin synthase